MPLRKGKVQPMMGCQPVFLRVRNDGHWDGDYSSQPPGHLDVAGNIEELRVGLQANNEPRVGVERVQFSSE